MKYAKMEFRSTCYLCNDSNDIPFYLKVQVHKVSVITNLLTVSFCLF